MHPIISGTEILIPLAYGERVTTAKTPEVTFFERPEPETRAAYIPAAAPVLQVRVPGFPAPGGPIMPVVPQALPPVPMGLVADVDLWETIAKLNWVDREDNFAPTLNPTRPSQKWTFAEWQAVQQKARPQYDQLVVVLDREDFWHRNGVADDAHSRFVWHVIARGQDIYAAVRADTNFGCGYIGQDCGFIDFMRNWS